jgi:hypothetical protein
MIQAPASVVLPLLRQHDEWLARAVRSALVQTVLCEVLIVPCPATPVSNLRTLERLRRDASDRLIIREGPCGFAAQLNVGFRTATAERVGLLFSDDWRRSRSVSPGRRTSSRPGSAPTPRTARRSSSPCDDP